MSQQAAMMMQPFMIPMVGFYCAPSAFGNPMHETQTSGMSPPKAPEQEHEIPEETGEKPHSVLSPRGELQPPWPVALGGRGLIYPGHPIDSN